MKQTFFVFLLFFAISASAQSLTGIWRGSFYNVREVMLYGSQMKSRYEVQIDDSKKAINGRKGVEGLAYSYQTTSFYGKASIQGIWNPEAKSLIFEENKLLEFRNSGGGDNITLFTCILDYKKENGVEILEGTYTSKHYKTGRDGGSGVVHLERVPDSDFEKADFLKKDQPKGKIKPGTEDFVVKKPADNTPKPQPKKQEPTPAVKEPAETPKSQEDNKTTTPVTPKPQVPVVLKQRQNELTETITTSTKDIVISFYDNGEIDGDTISVYGNNQLLAKSKGLSTQAVTINISLNENEPEYDIVMVAENLGSIPPNTALMIVQAGNKRYTVRLSSTESKNAMVKIKYKKE